MLERLRQLEENVAALERFKAEHSLAEIGNATTLQWALRYGIMESIQIVIDTACHICSSKNLGTPKNYGDCIRFLAQIGLRNLIIHEYAGIDTGRLYGFLEALDIFRSYAEAIRETLG
jgi:uncharacterized protein YutE (UPF0331/DUF86 family)